MLGRCIITLISFTQTDAAFGRTTKGTFIKQKEQNIENNSHGLNVREFCAYYSRIWEELTAKRIIIFGECVISLLSICCNVIGLNSL